MFMFICLSIISISYKWSFPKPPPLRSAKLGE